MVNKLDFITLPTKWDVTPQEVIDAAEMINKDYQEVLQDGFIQVNPYHITHFYESSYPNCTVLFINGGTIRITLPLHKIKEIINNYKNQ